MASDWEYTSSGQRALFGKTPSSVKRGEDTRIPPALRDVGFIGFTSAAAAALAGIIKLNQTVFSERAVRMAATYCRALSVIAKVSPESIAFLFTRSPPAPTKGAPALI